MSRQHHRAAPRRTAPHRAAPRRTAPRRAAPRRAAPRLKKAKGGRTLIPRLSKPDLSAMIARIVSAALDLPPLRLFNFFQIFQIFQIGSKSSFS